MERKWSSPANDSTAILRYEEKFPSIIRIFFNNPHVKNRRQRIEIFLPLQHNPDRRGKRQRISAELFRVTKNELMSHFAQEGLSFEFVTRTRTFGEWKGVEDEHLLIRIDVKMRASDSNWLKQYKEVLKERFEQEEIYIAYYDVIVV